MIQSKPVDRGNEVPAGQSPGKRILLRAGAAVLISAAIVGGLAVAFPKQFAHQIAISTTRQPTPYTQLFFTDPSALPKDLTVDRVNTFAFTVINDEGHAENYHYVITLTTGKSHEIVGEGSLEVGNNQRATRTAGVKPKSRTTRYLISVALNGTGDFVQFYGDTS